MGVEKIERRMIESHDEGADVQLLL
jgi:hypothetical protein